LRPGKSERHYLWAGRVAVVLLLILATLVAYRVELIFDVAAFMVAAAVAEMPANWAQWWWWRFNSWGRLTASFGGLIIPALVWFVLPTSHWDWWDKTYLVIAANMALTVLVTLLTQPDGWPILERFYQAAQPLGFWRPVRQQLRRDRTAGKPGNAAASDATGRESVWLIAIGLGLAMLGAVSVMLLVIGCSYLYVGEYGYAFGVLAVCAGTAIGFFQTYGPYLTQLEKWAPPRVSSATADTSVNNERDKAPTDAVDRAPSTEPISTDTIVALSMAVYGLLFLVGGAIWTQGDKLILNLIAGGGFMIVAAIAWWFGRL
jgi:hypothetical protein